MSNPFEGLDPDAVLAQLRQQADDLETKANTLRDELARATATTTSPDGAVTVTLSPTGALRNITFSAKAASVKPEALGPLVMRTVAAAQREVSAKVKAAVGTQPETLDFVTQFMPEPETPAKKPDRPTDEDFSGTLLRKRQGGGPR